jgi:hypothetical protein
MITSPPFRRAAAEIDLREAQSDDFWFGELLHAGSTQPITAVALRKPKFTGLRRAGLSTATTMRAFG